MEYQTGNERGIHMTYIERVQQLVQTKSLLIYNYRAMQEGLNSKYNCPSCFQFDWSEIQIFEPNRNISH